MLAELEVVFNFETPPLPEGFSDAFIPLTDAVTLVPLVSNGRIWFAHYDGFTLRVVVGEQLGSGWRLEERQHEIHSVRKDSSFDGERRLLSSGGM